MTWIEIVPTVIGAVAIVLVVYNTGYNHGWLARHQKQPPYKHKV